MDKRIALRQLREYAGRSQVDLAAAGAMTQPELSRLERRGDVRLSTLRRYIEALGGTLSLNVSIGSSAFEVGGKASEEKEPSRSDVAAAVRALRELGIWLEPLLEGLTRAQLTRRVDGCGEFSLLEHLWHLRDLELEAYGPRLSRMLRETEPELRDFDGDLEARRRRYNRRELQPALGEVLRARKKHCEALRALTAAQLRRCGTQEGVGRLSVAQLILRWRGHDLGHRIEGERLRAALVGSRGAAKRGGGRR